MIYEDIEDSSSSDIFVKEKTVTPVSSKEDEISALLVHILINLLTTEDVEDFKVWSGDVQYGIFADVIAEVTRKNTEGTSKIAIVLKNGENTVFNIMDYYEEYRRAMSINPKLSDYTHIVVLQTNINPGDIWDGNTMSGKLFSVQPQEDDDHLASLLGNKTYKGKPLKFGMVENKEKIVEDTKRELEEFLRKFYCYPRPPKAQERMYSELNFSTAELQPVIDFVREWSKQDKKYKLTKELLYKTVIEWLSPFIPFYRDITSYKDKELFLRAIQKFDATLIEEEDAYQLGLIWNQDDVKINPAAMGTFENGTVKHKATMWHLLMWQLHGGYLVVSLSEDNIDIISLTYRLCKTSGKRKFIFMADSKTTVPESFQEEVFQNFNDLKREDAMLFKSVGEDLLISLEEKQAIPLKEILGDEEVRKQLTPSHFLQMLEGPLLIGESAKKLPDYYIGRWITDYHIDFNYVNHMETDEDVALICGNVNFTQIQAKISNISEWSNMAAVSTDDTSKNLYFCNISQKETVFEEICKRSKFKNCVCLEYSEDAPTFKWLKSSKIDPKLHQFQQTIPDAAIKTEDYPLNIICNDPGMGKSWFLKSLQLNYPSKIVIYIEPKNHRFFEQEPNREEEYDDFLLSIAFKNELETAILKYLYLNKRVVILWDGLDEASQEKLPNIFNAVDYFKNIGLSQWMASREYRREMLENRFNILSRSIEIFDKTQQADYIKQRLRNNEETINSCAKITKDIMNHLRPNYVNQVFGIPLQLFMLTELLLDKDSNISQQLSSGLFSIATLYQHFLDGKFKVYEREKNGWNLETGNDQVAHLFENRQSLKENFEAAAIRALSAFLTEHVLKSVDRDSCDKFVDDIMKTGDNYGLITSVDNLCSDCQINFAHRTFAEFLGARYIIRNYKHDFINTVRGSLLYEQFKNVRFFMDAMLAAHSALHLAVLYKDVEKVKQLEKGPYCKDGFGRNPLNLAAMQAKYFCRTYELLPNTDHMLAKYAHDHIELPSSPPKDDALVEIFSYLKHYYKLDEEDQYLINFMKFSSFDIWHLLNKDLFESVPGPITGKYRDGCFYKTVIVSNIPSLAKCGPHVLLR